MLKAYIKEIKRHTYDNKPGIVEILYIDLHISKAESAVKFMFCFLLNTEG